MNGEDASVIGGALQTSATLTSNVGAYAITNGLYSTNYAISYTGANLSVTARPITVTADSLTKHYGASIPTLTYTVGGDGLVNGDTLSGALATTATASSDVGTYDITQGTLAASSNYTITKFTPGTLTVDAAGLTLTITPDAVTKTYGQSIVLTDYVADGLQNGDSLSGVTLTSAGTAASAHAGSYDIIPSNAVFGTGSASNYSITYVTLTDGLTVLPATLTVTANALSRIYGNANPALTYGYGGFVNGDTASLFTGSLTTSADATSGVGTYGIGQGTLSAGGDYTIAYTGANLGGDGAADHGDGGQLEPAVWRRQSGLHLQHRRRWAGQWRHAVGRSHQCGDDRLECRQLRNHPGHAGGILELQPDLHARHADHRSGDADGDGGCAEPALWRCQSGADLRL